MYFEILMVLLSGLVEFADFFFFFLHLNNCILKSWSSLGGGGGVELFFFFFFFFLMYLKNCIFEILLMVQSCGGWGWG